MSQLDKDAFEVLLANCADEPIQFPGARIPNCSLIAFSGLQCVCRLKPELRQP